MENKTEDPEAIIIIRDVDASLIKLLSKRWIVVVEGDNPVIIKLYKTYIGV